MSISAVAVILLFQLQDMELTPVLAKLERAEVTGMLAGGAAGGVGVITSGIITDLFASSHQTNDVLMFLPDTCFD